MSSMPARQQQLSAAQKLLVQLLCASSHQHKDPAAILGDVHQPLHTASEAETTITCTDASLQLASLHQAGFLKQQAPGIVSRWDAVQVLPAASDRQHHVVTAVQPADYHSEIGEAVLCGWSLSLCMQGVELRPTAAAVQPEQAAPYCPTATAGITVPSRVQHVHLPLNGVSADDMLASVQAQVMSAVARLLGTDSLAHNEPLMAAGLDSLGATELVQGLQTAFDITLPATLVFDYPTVAAIAAWISQQLMCGTQEGPDAQARAVALPAHAFSPEGSRGSHMALITGVAGDEKLLQQWTGGDDIIRVPHSRWDTSQQANTTGLSNKLAPQFGSFLNNVDQFDSMLFGIMASEALTMDPQQWLLLQTALGAFPNGPSSVKGRAVGAYVGIGTSDYNTLMQQSQVPFNAFSFTAGSASVASGRLAFAFGLQGPTASIDTACSASLVAAHMACQSFRFAALLCLWVLVQRSLAFLCLQVLLVKRSDTPSDSCMITAM